MACDEILMAREGKVMMLEIRRPERKNAFSQPMYWAMVEHLEAADKDPGIAAVVITGQADIFSAGNDLGDFLKHGIQPTQPKDVAPFRLLQALAQQQKPVIAAVCGPAVGIGATLLLHCDLVYAGTSASFHFPFVKLGLCAEGASSLLLPQTIGLRHAQELLLTGGQANAEQAEQWGLVTRRMPDEEVLPFALRTAQYIADLPAGGVQTTKALLRRSSGEYALLRLETEMTEFSRLLGSKEAANAIQGALQHRR